MNAQQPVKRNGLSAFGELWSAEYKRRTLMLWGLWFFALLGYYGLTTWLGALLQQAGSATPTEAQASQRPSEPTPGEASPRSRESLRNRERVDR